MERFFILIPFIERLSEGDVLKKALGWAFRALAFAAPFAALYASVAMWASGMGGMYFLTALLTQLALLAVGYAAMNALWARATEAFGVGGSRPIGALFAAVLKAAGESAALTFALSGLVSLFSLWFGGAMLTETMAINFPPMRLVLAGEGFAGGLLSLVIGLAWAFAAAFASYFLAELAGGRSGEAAGDGTPSGRPDAGSRGGRLAAERLFDDGGASDDADRSTGRSGGGDGGEEGGDNPFLA
jgi:hypothetical protein